MGNWKLQPNSKRAALDSPWHTMRRFSDLSPRRLSDISSQVRQLRYLAMGDPLQQKLRCAHSVVDVGSAASELSSVEVCTSGYYRHGSEPWYPSKDEQSRTQSISEGPTAWSMKTHLRPFHHHYCSSVPTMKKLVSGAVTAVCIAGTWAGTMHVAKVTLSSLDAPFFLTWFVANWNCLFFPLYYAGHAGSTGQRLALLKKFRDSSAFLREEGCMPKVFIKRVAPFGFLWTLTNYFYFLALRKISTTDAAVLFCCNKAFIFLLSWIVLKDRFMGVRIVATILSITGIVMMAYADGFHNESVVGVALAVTAASMSALYKVLFKVLIAVVSFGEASVFLMMLGAFNIFFLSWVPLILYLTKTEVWPPACDVPWDQLCSLAALFFAFNLLVNFGVAFTYPAVVSLGIFLSVAASAALDVHANGKAAAVFNDVRLAATAVIFIGFLLLLLPEDWDDLAIRFLADLKDRRKEERVLEDDVEAVALPHVKTGISGAQDVTMAKLIEQSSQLLSF